MIKKKKIRTMKTTSSWISTEAKKMYQSIGDTIYVDETKIYTKNNQYKVTADKDNPEYINSASDMVGIGGDSWFIEQVSNKTITIVGYDNHRTIQEKISIGKGVTDKTLLDGETVTIRLFEATILGEKGKYSTIHTTAVRKIGWY